MFKKIISKNNYGASLIEMLVIVSIISLLATMTVLSISTQRAKARDATRKKDLILLKTALELYHSKYGTYKIAGAGWSGNGQGWVWQSPNPIVNPNYAVGIVATLFKEGLLADKNLNDPMLSTTEKGYMLYLCDSDQTYSLSATLERPTPADIAHIQTTCHSMVVGDGTYVTYNKNYAIIGPP